jgi:hypothetical protein
VSRFIDEADRFRGTLLGETIDEYVSEENPVQVIDAFVGALDLAQSTTPSRRSKSRRTTEDYFRGSNRTRVRSGSTLTSAPSSS